MKAPIIMFSKDGATVLETEIDITGAGNLPEYILFRDLVYIRTKFGRQYFEAPNQVKL